MSKTTPPTEQGDGPTTRRDRRAIELFDRSLDIDEDRREAWVDAECGDDEALRAAVGRLLAADVSSGRFLHGDFSAGQLHNAIGTSVGSYRLDRLIAEGGMGAVYLAHRDDGVYTQTVAVKFIRPLLLDPDAIRRFESERQILAQLQHPNIAQVLDGGSSEDGTPYVVMEYVDGIPITDYCDSHRLDVAERLDLFRDVCSAVQAAHRNLIVHRDIKPGNILVTADGVPKLLDFGIAKILQPEGETENAPATVVALTPDYASPEQIQRCNVTTSSDVYSLGVVLYELLSGCRPYSLGGVTAGEAERLICQQLPPAPSEKLAERTDVKDVARRARALRGDLDTITMMALRKEPERRYGSVQELSEDILRYLRGLPISARRDSGAYRFAKFTGRHRWGMVAASLLVLSMIAGIVATSWQARVAREQAQRAEAQQAKAETQKQKAEKIGDFFRNILMSSSSLWTSKIRKGPDVTMAEVLEIASERADKELADQPEIHADVLDTIGLSLQGMGLYKKASNVGLRATTVADAQLPDDSPLRADTHYHYGMSLNRKGEFAAAEREMQIAIKRGTRIYPPDSEILALMHNDYSVLLATMSRTDAAIRELEFAIAIQRRLTKDEPNPQMAVGISNLGVLKMSTGDLKGALEAYNKSLRIFAQLPARKYAEMAMTLRERSRVYQLIGETDRARADASEAVRIARKILGRDHPYYALTLLRRAEFETASGNTVSAESDLREGQAIVKRHVDATHPYNAWFQVGFGELYLGKAEYARAQTVLGKAVASLDKGAGEQKYPDNSLERALRLLGKAELGLNHPQRAVDVLQRSLQMTTSLFGPDVYETRQTKIALAQATATLAGADASR